MGNEIEQMICKCYSAPNYNSVTGRYVHVVVELGRPERQNKLQPKRSKGCRMRCIIEIGIIYNESFESNTAKI